LCPGRLRGGGGVVHVLLPPLTAVASTCPAECRRCRALRAMAEETPAAVVGRACWLVQARFGGGDRPNAAWRTASATRASGAEDDNG